MRVDSNTDILTIAETKLDCSFPTAQFLVDRYKEPAHQDRSKYGESRQHPQIPVSFSNFNCWHQTLLWCKASAWKAVFTQALHAHTEVLHNSVTGILSNQTTWKMKIH